MFNQAVGTQVFVYNGEGTLGLEAGFWGTLWDRLKHMILPTLWIILDWFVTLLILYTAFVAVRYPIPMSFVVVGFAVGITLSLVSFIPGGLGVMEGSMAAIFSSLGVAFETAVVAVLVFVIGAAGIVFSIWWGFRHHIEQPLNRLLAVMARVEEGDRSQRATIGGPQEYRRLAGALNGMLDAMAEKDADIEARRLKEIELEKRLRKSRKLAELGVLAAGVAHEIGAPLTVINGQAQRLARHETIGDDERARLGRIRSEVDRIVEIVRQLMELGRRHNVEKERLPLDALVESARELVEEDLERRDIRLEVDLPTPTPHLLVNGQQLIQVLTNLLRNASQAGEVRRVRLRVRMEGDELRLWLEDDGSGIVDADKSKVFDPFFTTKPVGQGSGLGLSMVHRIINDHGGTIGVFDSDLGGAGFEIGLPLDDTMHSDITERGSVT